eukprot:TRINITY_DN6212_c0_g1_i2.p1 TRINITY_DN6212_c0_g1~~TRINITY_DN6212_c0_g1_i2.p1  ORF type:complete len:389 (-),score=81.23 TRINITY_DN6212_c0_g1_i2:59-1225(-)
MKNHFDSLEQVNNLREIQALRKLSPHPHIIKLLEVLFDEPTGRLALVFELMDMNVYDSIRGRKTYLSEQKVKWYMYQLLKAIDHMHKNGIFHRDIKPENILLVDDTLKLADFGSCRGIFSKQPYTEYISTRWYRAPECILTDGYYNYKMDMWGVGCVFFEIISLFALFPGQNELDQINRIHNILGTPSKDLLDKYKKFSKHMDFNFPQKEGKGIAKYIPHASQEAIDLIEKLLAYNPDDRLTAKQALKHPYFKDLVEQERRAQMPAGPNSTFRLTHNGEGDDKDSESKNGNNSTVGQNINNINININTINGAPPRKKNQMLPDLKKYAGNSEDEDLMDSLPPIKASMGPKKQTMANHASKGMLAELPGKKKSYISPYSQKAIVSSKLH